MAFPTSLDNLSNPTPTDTMNTVPHSAQHSNANDAIEALQVKVGINSSADTNSIDYKLANLIQTIYPVGAIYVSGVSTSPATLFGFGTWTQISNRVIVGQGSGTFATLNATGGAETHTLTSAEMPVHTHVQDAHTHTQNAHDHLMTSVAIGATRNYTVFGTDAGVVGDRYTNSTTATNQNTTATNQNAGSGGSHNNLQPYIVKYIWERTA